MKFLRFPLIKSISLQVTQLPSRALIANQANHLHWFSALLIGLFLWGCNAKNYDAAQRAFSSGAQMVNAEILGIDVSATGATLNNLYATELASPNANAALAQFKLAKERLERALQRPEKLSKSGLLGNAHTLLALTELELSNYAAAIEQARLGRIAFNTNQGVGESPEGGRDRGMVFAVAPMAIINQTYDSLQLLALIPPVTNSDSSTTTLLYRDFIDRNIVSDSNTSLMSALTEIDFAIGKTTSSPETVQYLRNVQMAALANYRSAMDHYLVIGQRSGQFRRDSITLNQFETSLQKLETTVATYQELLLNASPNGEQNPFYIFWQGKVF